jgi:hypothetical protein
MVEKTALFGFWSCGIRTEGGGKLATATVNPFAITSDLK